jgi:precorrin-2/cobalt-factor-2 C20-methyltransferase
LRKFYGIGVGPGDKELITLKAYNIIKSCDYVFMPKSKGECLAGKIVEDYISGKKVIELEFPMGENNSSRYIEAAGIIDKTLNKGEIGIFLTLGDPMTYSTYIYLLTELNKHEIEVSTVPGITSYGAAASSLNIPITLKGESFYLCDGTIEDEVLKRIDSICILKVNKNKEEILNKLESQKFRYAYVRRCTQNDEKVLYKREDILMDDDYMSLIIARRGVWND